MLVHRLLEDRKGRATTRGFVVRDALIWYLVVEKLFQELTSWRYLVKRYVNDILIIVRFKFLEILKELIQGLLTFVDA